MQRVLITSALPYINGVKHLGNLIGSLLPADVYARYQRARKKQVLYICATDEHGTPAELAAEQAGMDVATYCAGLHAQQSDLYARFSLSFDYFGRSSSPCNHALTQQFARALKDNGYVYEKVEDQVYSLQDKRFLPDRYICGECPHCSFPRARGDQCDNCGRLLEPAELINPYSVLSGSHAVEKRKTRHLFLAQSKLQGKIKSWLESRKDFSTLASSIAWKWIDEGLKDRSITRDLSWGVPVVTKNMAWPGFENKVFYVWFDAPIAYISATYEWAQRNGKNGESFWRLDKGADDLYYVQFMGKDNVAFHTVSYPATLLGSGLPWKSVDSLKSFNWLTWYGGKFSTSQQTGIFMDAALDILPADYWRWWLLKNAPEADDVSFSLRRFAEEVNKDLADTLGNFINRIGKLICRRYPEGLCINNTQSTDVSMRNKDDMDVLTKEAPATILAYFKALDAMSFRKAAAKLRRLWAIGNEFVQESAPWQLCRDDPEKGAIILYRGLNYIGILLTLSSLFLPESCKKMGEALGFKDNWREIWDIDSRKSPQTAFKELLHALPDGHVLSSIPVAFVKISEEDIRDWEKRFNAPLEEIAE